MWLKPRSVQPRGKTDFFLVPFWHVHTTPDSASANMHFSEIQVKMSYGNTKTYNPIPVLTNSVPLKANTMLLQFKSTAGANKPQAKRVRS